MRVPGGLELSYAQLGLIASIILYALAMPGDLRFKLSALGFGVCHQISTHSFFMGSHQLPLCARCSGIYIGAVVSVVIMAALRKRSSGLPVRHVLAILALFFGAMLVDGANSTLQAFGAPLYDPNNLLRIFTGTLSGVAAAAIFYPLFNLSLWHRSVSKREHIMRHPVQPVGYLLAAGVVVAGVLSAEDFLYYPIAALSIAGMLMLLTMANTMLVLAAIRREATYFTLSRALTPILIGLLVSLIELSLFAWGRGSLAPYLSNNLGMPLVPGLP